MKKEKNKPYHHGNLRQTFLDAAIHMIDQEGIHALSLRELARRTQVSQAAPYRHFSSKDELVASVAEQGFTLLSAQMKEAGEHQKSDPVQYFKQLGIAYVLFAAKHPAHLRLMFGSAIASAVAHAGLQQAREEVASLLLNALASCRQSGCLKEGALEELAVCAWSMVHGLSMLLVEGRLFWILGSSPEASLDSIRKIAEQVANHLFVGIGMVNES